MQQSMQMPRPPLSLLGRCRRGLITFTCFCLVLGVGASANAACDEQGTCVEGGTWTANASLSDKARRKIAKKNRKKGDIDLTVSIEGGRGSVFVDGVWISSAPLEGHGIKPGRHDIQVRDGKAVLAQGVLMVRRKSSGVTITVPHG